VSSIEGLQKAIQAARAGRKVEARDLLIQIVEINPQNEMAWVWLTGLVDSLEDRIIACENVLTINPANQKVRVFLEELQSQQQSLLEDKNREDAITLFNQEDYAGLAAAEARSGKALQLAGYAAALRESIGAPLPPSEQARVNRMIAPAREALLESIVNAEWETGRSLELDQAIELALSTE